MLLTDEERSKFIDYLRESVNSTRLLIEQMDKIQVTESMKNVLRIQMMAEEIVLRSLEGIELQRISK